LAIACSTCQTRTLRRSIGDHRANGRAIPASVHGAVRRKRQPHCAPSQAQLSVSGRAGIGCAIIAGALRSVRSTSVVGMVEARLRRSSARTSKAPGGSTGKRETVQRPSVTETIADTTDTVELARLTLQVICRDKNSPAAARAQAARTLLELAGALKNTVADTARKTAPELTLAELDERLETLSRDGA
jgi:hypothetical protein